MYWFFCLGKEAAILILHALYSIVPVPVSLGGKWGQMGFSTTPKYKTTSAMPKLPPYSELAECLSAVGGGMEMRRCGREKGALDLSRLLHRRQPLGVRLPREPG
jgi:hypothetical protein